MNFKKKSNLLLIFFTLIFQNACLKTRAQLQEDNNTHTGVTSQPIAATSSSRKSAPSASYEIDEIKAEIARLTGRLEAMERQGSSGAGPNTTDLTSINTRLDELEKAQIEIISRLRAIQVATAVDPNELYNNALTEFNNKNYQKTIEILNLYLKENKPRREADAVFLRAESYFNLQEYKRAILDYSKFAEGQFGKKHKKNAEALFQIATSFEKLGMKDESGVFYKDLLDRFPASPQAKAAKKKINNSDTKKQSTKKKTPPPPSKRKPSSLEEVNDEDTSSEETEDEKAEESDEETEED